MLAAYTFESALELSDFCARHDIGAKETYTVLQSLVPCTFDGEYSRDLLLTLVIDLMPHVLEDIKEHESAYQEAYREHVRREEEGEQQGHAEEPSDGTRPGDDAPGPESEDMLYPDGIPF